MGESVRLLSRLVAWQEMFEVNGEAMLRLMDIIESTGVSSERSVK